MLLGPAELRSVVVSALGLSNQPETIDVHYRNLRDAGLVTRSRRGRGAASAGIDDAVRLFIAALGSPQVKDSATTVTTYAGLRLAPDSVSVRGPKDRRYHYDRYDWWWPLEQLPPDHSFERVLQEAIALLAVNSFVPPDLPSRVGEEAVFLSVRLYQPLKAASLHFGARRLRSVSQVYGDLPARSLRTISDPSNVTPGHVMTIRIADLAVMRRIAKAFAPPDRSID